MSAGQEITLVVDDGAQGQRLDLFVAAALPDFSRSRLQALIREGRVLLAGRPAVQVKEKVAAGQTIMVSIPPLRQSRPVPQAIALDIRYEDDDLIVIEKPAGLVTHPAPGHPDGTLVNALLHHCGATLSGIGGEARPGIVHRLDKDTSGLMVAAKHDLSHQGLAEQFADHGREGDLVRAYLALVWTKPSAPKGVIRKWLDRDPKNRQKRAVVADERGKYAETHFEVLKTYAVNDDLGKPKPLASLARCQLFTGRTHQIRVHMADLGHPLLADWVYGAHFRSKANLMPPGLRAALDALGGRQALHAAELSFRHPISGELLHFTSPLPPDLLALKDALDALP